MSGVEIFLEQVTRWQVMEENLKKFLETVGEKDLDSVVKKIKKLEEQCKDEEEECEEEFDEEDEEEECEEEEEEEKDENFDKEQLIENFIEKWVEKFTDDWTDNGWILENTEICMEIDKIEHIAFIYYINPSEEDCEITVNVKDGIRGDVTSEISRWMTNSGFFNEWCLLDFSLK